MAETTKNKKTTSSNQASKKATTSAKAPAKKATATTSPKQVAPKTTSKKTSAAANKTSVAKVPTKTIVKTEEVAPQQTTSASFSMQEPASKVAAKGKVSTHKTTAKKVAQPSPIVTAETITAAPIEEASPVQPTVVDQPQAISPIPVNTVLYDAPETTNIINNNPESKEVKGHKKSSTVSKLVWAMLIVALCLFVAASALLIVTIVKDKGNTDNGSSSGPTSTVNPPAETITYTPALKSELGNVFNTLFDVNTSSLTDSDIFKKQLIGVLPSAFEYAQVPVAVAEDIIDFIPTITTTLESLTVNWDKLLGFEGEQQLVDFVDELIKAKDYEKLLTLIQDFFKTGITTDQASKVLYKMLDSQTGVIVDNAFMLSNVLLDMQGKAEAASDVATSMQYLVLGLIFDIAPGAVQDFVHNENNRVIIESTFKDLCEFALGFANAYYESGISDFLDLLAGVVKGEVDGEVLGAAADKVYKAIEKMKDAETGKYFEISNQFKTKINSTIIYIKALIGITGSAMNPEQQAMVNYYVNVFTNFLNSIKSVDTLLNGAIDFVAQFFKGFTKEIDMVTGGGSVVKIKVAEAFAINLSDPSVRIVDPADSAYYYFAPNLDTIIVLSNILEGSLTRAQSTFSDSFFSTLKTFTTVIPGGEGQEMIGQVNGMIDQARVFLNTIANFSKKLINIPVGADINDSQYAEYLTCTFATTVLVDSDENTETPDEEVEVEIIMTHNQYTDVVENYLNALLATQINPDALKIKDIIIVPATFIMVAAMTPATVTLWAVTQPIILLLNNYAGLEIDAGIFDIKSTLETYFVNYEEKVSEWLDLFLNNSTS